MLSAGRRSYDADDLAGAARAGDFKKVERILDGMVNFAHINRPNEYGQTALHKAAISGRPDIISLLLASGASIDARDHYGSTPLHVACQFNKTAAVHILLEHGADDTVQDNFGATPLQRCKDFGHLECERVLVRYPIIKEMNKRIEKLERDLESVDLDMLFLSEQIRSDKGLMEKALARYRKSAEEKHAKMLERRRQAKEKQLALRKQQEERIRALSSGSVQPAPSGGEKGGNASGQGSVNQAGGSGGSKESLIKDGGSKTDLK